MNDTLILLIFRIAARAVKDEKFKQVFVLTPANIYHFYEAKIKFRFMNIGVYFSLNYIQFIIKSISGDFYQN